MGWAIGYDKHWHRDIGYGVPAYCDHPDCSKEIDRGLAYVCGGEPKGGEHGCGLYFCAKHLSYWRRDSRVCSRCANYRTPYAVKPDHPEWLRHKLTDASWQEWRDKNPTEVAAIESAISATAGMAAKVKP